MTKILFTILILTISTSLFSQNVTEEWVQRYNGPGNGDDRADAMTVDAAGNVYVSGIAFTGVSPWFQGVIIKYDTSGDVVWEVTNDSIFPTLISIDALGNVYVTGGSYIGTFSTTKYNGNGIRQWSQDYTGNGSLEKPVAMTVDAAGNVYVTGESYGDTTRYDFLTIKISSTGNLLWARTYNGPVNWEDRVSAIAVDGSGNVFVSGTISAGNNRRQHIGTIKYNSSGTLLWERTWLGTDYLWAYGSDLTLDNSGNVYITGSGIGPSFWWQYVTLKYSSGGTLLWEQTYEGVGGLNCNGGWSNAITSDVAGNVYVTGGIWLDNCKTEIATIKYNSAGGVQWIARFVDPDGEDNEGYFITVDNSGNVYVTGINYANKILSVKYNSTGQLQWYIKYISPVSGGYAYSLGIGVDANENLYVAGASDGVGTGRDFVTIKYAELKPPTNLSYNEYLHRLSWNKASGHQGYIVFRRYLDSPPDSWEFIGVDSGGVINSGDSIYNIMTNGFCEYKVGAVFQDDTLFSNPVSVSRGFFLRKIVDGKAVSFNIYEHSFRNIPNKDNPMWMSSWYNRFDYNNPASYPQEYFGGLQSYKHIDWELAVEISGVDNAYLSYPNNLKPGVFNTWRTRTGRFDGSCFGFTAAALHNFFQTPDFTNRYAFFNSLTPGSAVPSDDSTRKMINELFGRQIFGNTFKPGGVALRPNQIINLFAEAYSRYNEHPFVNLVMYIETPKFKGNHSLLAYAIEKVSESLSYIYIYDSNYPLENDLKIEVNTIDNTYRHLKYDSEFIENGLKFESGIKDILTQTGTENFRSSDTIELNTSRDNSIFILSGNDTIAGFNITDSTVINRDLSFLIQSDGILRAPVYYNLDGENYQIVMKDYLTPDGNPGIYYFGLDNNAQGVNRTGTVALYEEDIIVIDNNKLLYQNPDTNTKKVDIYKVINNGISELQSAKYFKAENLAVSNGDSIMMSKTSGDDIYLANYGDATEFDILLTYTTSTDYEVFINMNVEIATNTAITIQPTWEDLMLPVVVLIDNGINGTIDDTTFIDNVLPVDLISFDAIVDGRDVMLSWKTAWEVNNDRFEIFRKMLDNENTQWIKIGIIPGNGNTNEPVTYSYTDKNLTTGKYEYKLIQIDYNGMQSADWELNQTVHIGVPDYFDLHQNYPNPFNPTTKIDFQIPVEGLVKLVVYDISGREVATLVNEVKTPGYYQTEFNGANFASGVYFYRLVTNNNVMTKKFMLLK